jgi:hypothetical protein
MDWHRRWSARILLRLAALTFASGSGGAALALVGENLFDGVEVAAHWRQSGVNPPEPPIDRATPSPISPALGATSL